MAQSQEKHIIPSLMIALAALLAVAVFTALWFEHKKTKEDFIDFAGTEAKIVLDTVVEAIQTTAGIRRHLQEKNVQSNVVRDIVKNFGTGKLLQRLGRYGTFDYLVCQDQLGIVVAHGVTNVSSISSDTFLQHVIEQDSFQTRMLPGTPLRLEAVRAFETDDHTYLLRVCMHLTTVELLQERMVRRLALLGAVFLFVILLLVVYLINVNNALLLSRERDVITRRVEHMQRQLRQQERVNAMGRLAAGVAHEIRNPLNAAQILVQRLIMEVVPKSDSEEKFNKFTRVIRQELDRLNHIVKEFLEFSRARKVVLEDVDPRQITWDVCLLEKGEAEQNAHELIEEIPDTIEHIQADKEQVHQALVNIVKNALEAIGEGGRVYIKLQQDKKRTIWRIEDNGPGMTEEEIEKAFDLYYTTKESGMGLGLAISQRIVQAHEGEIHIYPLTPTGTCVEIEIPHRSSNEDTIS